MIVKDESHIIEKTLSNLCNHIKFDYYVICDTGSKDNTIQIIKDFFNKKNIEGEVLEHEWKNFEYNRNLALEYAKDKAHYSFIFDADDYIHGEIGSLVLPSELSSDGYNLLFKGGGSSYYRTLLINNRKKWVWVGVLHEVLTCKDVPHKIEEIEGNYSIESGRTGSRNMDPLKYQKDALIFENALADPNTDASLIGRYAFYCGQSWKDFNNYTKGIYWYKKVVNEYNNWSEEKYYACIKLGEMYEKLNKTEDALFWYLSANKFNPKRLEGVCSAACILLSNKMFNYAAKILEESWNSSNLEYPLKEFLFATDNSYMYDYLSLTSRAAYYSNNYDLCKKSTLKLIDRFDKLNIKELCVELINLQFYIPHFTNYEKFCIFEKILSSINRVVKETDCFESQKVLQNCDKYFNNLVNTLFSENFNDWEGKINATKNLLNFKKKQNKLKPYNVILTMTTCKRYDLFKKTMDSILYFWDDIDSIDRFVIIDDNSSEDDKNQMLFNYPFIELIEKDEEQKGHRSSMNIIWNLLNTVKPKYWIHLEDDWLFFKNGSYVKRPIEALNLLEEQNVKQILYNKGYGELISDLCVPIGETVIEEKSLKSGLKNNILLHIQNQKLPISSCSYWWHYSFRPSLISTEAILKLGNYDSNNTFFELDYAKRYVESGFKSAYYDNITSLHIGRLSGSRANNESANAYTLNNTEQFGNSNSEKENNIKSDSDIVEEIEKVNLSEYLPNGEKYLDINEEFIFIYGYDIMQNDLFYDSNKIKDFLLNMANMNNACVAVNSLGFFKNKIVKLEKSPYFTEKDGIYIKKKYLNIDI